MSYVHRIKVRYGECDMQGVVFNANYLAYCDDALVGWWDELAMPPIEELGWDAMLKKAVVEWHGPARPSELLDIAVSVSRWGRTSFDVLYAGAVGGRPVFDATITYVGVRPGTTEPTPPPESVRALMDGTPSPASATG